MQTAKYQASDEQCSNDRGLAEAEACLLLAALAALGKGERAPLQQQSACEAHEATNRQSEGERRDGYAEWGRARVHRAMSFKKQTTSKLSSSTTDHNGHIRAGQRYSSSRAGKRAKDGSQERCRQ